MDPRVEKWNASIDENVSKCQNFHDRYLSLADRVVGESSGPFSRPRGIRLTGPANVRKDNSIETSHETSRGTSHETSHGTSHETSHGNDRPNIRKNVSIGADVDDSVARVKRRSVELPETTDVTDTVAARLGFIEYDDDLEELPRDDKFRRDEETFFALVAGAAFTSINNIRIRELVDASNDEYITKISPHLLSAIESSRQHVEELVGSRLYEPMSKLYVVYSNKRYRVLFSKVVANAYTSAKQRSSQRNYSSSQLVVNNKDRISLDGQIRKFFGAEDDEESTMDVLFGNIKYQSGINRNRNRSFIRY